MKSTIRTASKIAGGMFGLAGAILTRGVLGRESWTSRNRRQVSAASILVLADLMVCTAVA